VTETVKPGEVRAERMTPQKLGVRLFKQPPASFDPITADPRELLRYTLREQVLETYDFTAAVRTALREFNPDVLLCAGPGTSLRAPVGHVVLREGWRGLRDKAALFSSGVIATA